MSYDPTQQTPQPSQYGPTQQGYPPTQQSYTPPQSANYAQYPGVPQPPVVYAAPGQPAGGAASAFVGKLGLLGKIAGGAGLAVVIFFFFPWIAGATSYNGWSLANGFDTSGGSFSLFPYLWLVLLGALGLIALAVLPAQRRLSQWAAAIATIATSGVMAALGLCFLVEANAILRGSSGSIGAGFWLAFLATLGVLGGAIYDLVQQRKGHFAASLGQQPYAPAPSYVQPDQYPAVPYAPTPPPPPPFPSA
jgi:hypothetical protein